MKRESDKIVSIAVLKAKAGMRERLRHELLALIAPTRREPGNLDYVLFELKDEPGTFYMREAFVSQAALDATARRTISRPSPARRTTCWQSPFASSSWKR